MQQNQKFCPLPWIIQAIRNDGSFRACSNSHSSVSKGLLHKEDGSVYHAGSDNLSEAFNSKDLKSLRISMLNNENHPICSRCDKEEVLGVRSRRNVENENWKHKFTLEDAKSITTPNGEINRDPIYFDMRFGNKCNLKCRSCSPTDSNFWYEDHTELWGQTSFTDGNTKVNLVREGSKLVEDTDMYRWYENPGFWAQMFDRLKSVEQIHTVGGEPLLIDQHFNLLEKCIEMKIAHKITIEYNSNITVIPDRAWGLWSHFKRINIGASIDGVGRVNDYIRHPSKFENIFHNLQKIDNTPDNIFCWIATTVQVYNAHHLPELMKWVVKNKFNKVQRFLAMPILNCHPLHNPQFLSSKILPKNVKDWIATLYSECNEWMEKNAHLYLEKEWADVTITHVKEILSAYESHMYSEDLSHLLPKFMTYTKRLDSMRKESFEHSIPELWEKLKPYTLP
jgi:hypothetical protein